MSSSSRYILSAGIFSSEPGQRLLSICDTLSRRAFHGLYTKCENNVQGTYYQTGLKRVHVWSDAIVNEDIDFVRRTCPDIDETYEMCFVHYVEERYRGSRRPVINCPNLLKFVRHFLESVALHEHLQTAEFFTTRDVVQRRITCMDACRQAFYSLVNADSVRVELESTVSRGTTRNDPPSEVSVVRAPSQLQKNDVVLESEEPEISPFDSISQINVPHSVASRAVEEDVGHHPPSQRMEAREDVENEHPPSPVHRREYHGMESKKQGDHSSLYPSQDDHRTMAPSPPASYVSKASSRHRPSSPSQEDRRPAAPTQEDRRPAAPPSQEYRRSAVPPPPSQEDRRSAAPPPPSSYISTASSTSRRRADDIRDQRRAADDDAVRRYKPELMDDTQSEVSRHDFEMMDTASVASLNTRSVVGSRDSRVEIGLKRPKSPRGK